MAPAFAAALKNTLPLLLRPLVAYKEGGAKDWGCGGGVGCGRYSRSIWYGSDTPPTHATVYSIYIYYYILKCL